MSEAQSSVANHSPARSVRAVAADPRDDPPILVSDAPPTATQRRVAWGILVVLGVAIAVVAPFFDIEFPVVSAFVPVVHAVVFFTALIAAAFLFSQYRVQPQPAFLALASGYLAAGLFAFFQSLAFPDAYAPMGLFGGGPSAAAWLFLLWRTSFPLGILAYALMQRPATAINFDRPVAIPIALTTVCTVVGALLLTWLMTAAGPHLPTLFTDATHEAPYVHFVTGPAIVLSIVAVMLLLARRRTTLDLWLIVTLIAALPDVVVPVSRFALGFYVARSYELISSCAVLIALLTEASTLYARLARAKVMEGRAETARFSSVEAATATVAHEVRQPLNAIRIHANVGAKLLRKPSPSLAEVEDILIDIEKDACRANDVIDRIRGFARPQALSLETLDINAIVTDVARLVSDRAVDQRVAIVTALSSECPPVVGDRTQITQVLLNLVSNGIDAMEAVPAAQRRLTLSTGKRDGAIVMSVSDSGCGISPENMASLFDPFFTTRSEGLGLGLSIAWSIAQAHRGRLWAENNASHGATFHFAVPVAAT